MKKNKFFSVVSSGVLALSIGAPSVLAATPFTVSVLEASNHNSLDIMAYNLVDIIDGIEESTYLGKMSIVRTSDRDWLIQGRIPENSKLEVRDSNYQIISVIEEEEILFSLSMDSDNDQLNFMLIENDVVQEEIGFELSQLLVIEESNKADDTNTDNEYGNSTEVPLETESTVDKTPILDEEKTINDLGTESAEVQSDDEDEINKGFEKENAVKEDEAIVEKDEVIIKEDEAIVKEDEVLQEETKTSFERFGEVNELLHGETETYQPTTAILRNMLTTSSSRSHVDGLYTVRAGDTFNAIAQSFNLSTTQLREWNGHVSNINQLIIGTQLAVTRRGVERLLSPADQERLYKGGATPVFSTAQGFIDEIAPRAIAIANLEGQEALWPSLMIAQAAHESNYGRSALASPPYHNLSGIKGAHNGKSVLMWTWEVYSGVRVDVLAGFRHYPSYTESLTDYANLLRRGLSWDRNYYSGTWRSKTSSVWDVLNNNGLRGYATDPNYLIAMRRIINQYDLTKYDGLTNPGLENEIVIEENIPNSVSTKFNGVLKSGYSIDSLPWGMNGFKRVGLTRDFSNQVVNVVRETHNGLYLLIELNGELLGWVDHRAVSSLEVSKVTDGKDIYHHTSINGNNLPLLTLPSSYNNSYEIGKASTYSGQEVIAVQESPDGKSVLLQKNNRLLGWVSTSTLRKPVIEAGNTKLTSYGVVITKTGFTIDTLPWGYSGFQKITRTNHYIGSEATVRRETTNGKYLLLEVDGNILGWVDNRSVDRVNEVKHVPSSLRVDYNATITNSGFSIDTLPWGTRGFQRIATTSQYLGTQVKITHHSGSYVLAEINGTPLGWMDRRAFDSIPSVPNVTESNVPSNLRVAYTATISNSGFSIDTLPWGTSGYRRIASTSHYIGSRVNITHRSKSYVFAELNGVPLGWIDRTAFDSIPSAQSVNGNSVNYTATLRRGYSIDSKPWGTNGFERISLSSFYAGKRVQVTEQSGAYALIRYNGQRFGWVDRRALQR